MPLNPLTTAVPWVPSEGKTQSEEGAGRGGAGPKQGGATGRGKRWRRRDERQGEDTRAGESKRRVGKTQGQGHRDVKSTGTGRGETEDTRFWEEMPAP